MERIINLALLISAIILMASILLQQRGASLGSAFGGSSSVYRSRRGSEKVLFRISIFFSIVFISLALAALIY